MIKTKLFYGASLYIDFCINIYLKKNRKKEERTAAQYLIAESREDNKHQL